MPPARAWFRLHVALTATWVLLIVPTLLWWSESILWVGLMSIWANIAGHWSAAQAAHIEARDKL